MALPLESSRDLWLTGGEVTPEGEEATSFDALGQRIERMLNTPRNFFPYKHLQNRGFCVPQYVLSKAPLWVIRSGIEQECQKDDQVSSASALVTQNADGSLSIQVVVASPLGNFTLTMTATDAAATLLTIENQSGAPA